MIVTIFCSLDQSQLTNYSDDKNEWGGNSSLGYIDSTISSKPLNLARILVARLPIPPENNLEGPGETTAMNTQ